MDIEKAAWDYLSSTPEKPKKKMRRTRKALVNAYDAVRKKYIKEKEIVDSIIDEANRLKKNYDKHNESMMEHFNKMKALRDRINSIDDEGKEFTNMHEEPEVIDDSIPSEEDLDKLDF